MASTDVAKGLQYKVFINPDNAWDRTANVEEARSSMVKEPTIKDDEPWRYSGTPEVSLRLQVPTSVDPEVQHHYNQGPMMIREFLEEHSADLIKDISSVGKNKNIKLRRGAITTRFVCSDGGFVFGGG